MSNLNRQLQASSTSRKYGFACIINYTFHTSMNISMYWEFCLMKIQSFKENVILNIVVEALGWHYICRKYAGIMKDEFRHILSDVGVSQPHFVDYYVLLIPPVVLGSRRKVFMSPTERTCMYPCPAEEVLKGSHQRPFAIATSCFQL